MSVRRESVQEGDSESAFVSVLYAVSLVRPITSHHLILPPPLRLFTRSHAHTRDTVLSLTVSSRLSTRLLFFLSFSHTAVSTEERLGGKHKIDSRSKKSIIFVRVQQMALHRTVLGCASSQVKGAQTKVIK